MENPTDLRRLAIFGRFFLVNAFSLFFFSVGMMSHFNHSKSDQQKPSH